MCRCSSKRSEALHKTNISEWNGSLEGNLEVISGYSSDSHLSFLPSCDYMSDYEGGGQRKLKQPCL